MRLQRVISSTVRPQPRQRPARASRVQILTQGLGSRSWVSSGRVGCDLKHRIREGNRVIVARLEVTSRPGTTVGG